MDDYFSDINSNIDYDFLKIIKTYSSSRAFFSDKRVENNSGSKTHNFESYFGTTTTVELNLNDKTPATSLSLNNYSSSFNGYLSRLVEGYECIYIYNENQINLYLPYRGTFLQGEMYYNTFQINKTFGSITTEIKQHFDPTGSKTYSIENFKDLVVSNTGKTLIAVIETKESGTNNLYDTIIKIDVNSDNTNENSGWNKTLLDFIIDDNGTPETGKIKGITLSDDNTFMIVIVGNYIVKYNLNNQKYQQLFLFYNIYEIQK